MLSISSSGAALLFLAAPTWPEPAARHFKERGSDSSEYSFAEHIVPSTLSTHAFNASSLGVHRAGICDCLGYCSTRRLASSATDMNRLMPPSGGLLRQPVMSALGQSATSVRRSQHAP